MSCKYYSHNSHCVESSTKSLSIEHRSSKKLTLGLEYLKKILIQNRNSDARFILDILYYNMQNDNIKQNITTCKNYGDKNSVTFNNNLNNSNKT